MTIYDEEAPDNGPEAEPSNSGGGRRSRRSRREGGSGTGNSRGRRSRPREEGRPREAGGADTSGGGGGTATSSSEGGGTTAVGGVKLNAAQLPLVTILMASVVLFIATGAEYNWNFGSSYRGYALSVSVIAMVLSVFGLALTKAPNDVYLKVGKQLTMLIFSYSFIGACFLTFDKPFTTTSNGYFAAWATVYGSALAMGMSGDALQSGVKGLGAKMGLLASSLIVIVASIAPIRDGYNKSEAAYALSLACITFVSIIFALKRGSGESNFLALSLLAICWIVEACLVTFRGPFKETGNGYFASWSGAFTSVVSAFNAMHEL